MALEVKGQIKLIKDTVSIGTSGFQKREFVVEVADNPTYPQPILFEVVKDKVGVLDNFKVGQTVKVEFNLRGNEHNGRHYVSLQAWKILAEGAAGGASQSGARTGSGKPAGGASRPTRPAAPAGGDEDAPW